MDLLTGADYATSDAAAVGCGPDLGHGVDGAADYQPPQSSSSAGGPNRRCQDGDSVTTLCFGECQPDRVPEDKLVPFDVPPEEDVVREEYCHPRTVQSGVVRLLQTVRIPPGYQKAVKARINRELEPSLLLFTPQVQQPHVLVPDGAMEGTDRSNTKVVVENHGLEPIQLHEGVTLGTVVPVEEVIREQDTGNEVCGLGTVTQLPDVACSERVVLKINAEPITH